MNIKSVLTAIATAALLGTGSAYAADRVSLDESVRVQMRHASAGIDADIRTSLREQPLVLDVPGVEVGEIRIVDAANDSRPLLESSGVLDSERALHLEMLLKLLEVPSFHVSYRILSVPTVAMGR